MKPLKLNILGILVLGVTALNRPHAANASAGFTLSATNVTLSSSGTGSSTVTLTAVDGYSGIVSLECTFVKGPAGAATAPICVTTPAHGYTLGPSQLTQTGTLPFEPPGSAIPAVQTRNQPPPSPAGSSSRIVASGVLAMASVVLLGVNKRLRSSRWLCVALFGIAIVTGLANLSACGGSGGIHGIPAGTYTFNVVAADQQSHTETTSITVTVPAN